MPGLYIFAGAGLSASSGLATFRDSGGLWENPDVNKVCDFTQFLSDRNSSDAGPLRKTFDFYNARKKDCMEAVPSKAHLQIAAWQQEYGAERVHVVTSNIDDLLERAGCTQVVHVHGDLFHMQCAVCSTTWHIGSRPFEATEVCPECASDLTKPGVVFFGESAPEYQTMYQRFDPKKRSKSDVLVWVGSSMAVLTPSRVFQLQGSWGAPSPGFKVLIDPNAKALNAREPVFDLVLEGDADSQLANVSPLLGYLSRR